MYCVTVWQHKIHFLFILADGYGTSQKHQKQHTVTQCLGIEIVCYFYLTTYKVIRTVSYHINPKH